MNSLSSATLLAILSLLLFSLLLFRFLQKPQQKGRKGEKIVEKALQKSLPKEQYHTFHNLILPIDGTTTQIDHIVLSPYGVFVIETKHIKGVILAQEREKTWVQQLGRHTYSFQNPLHQNHKHIKALQHHLKLPFYTLHSLVIFTAKTTLQPPIAKVFTSTDEMISSILSKQTPSFTSQQLQQMYRLLQKEQNAMSHQKEKAHIASLKDKKQPLPSSCPLCGGKLILREPKGGKKGDAFYGCEAYPKCYYTFSKR